MSENLTLPVYSPDGKAVNSVEIPERIFGVTANTALMHQVVTAQLAAARQGTHAVKNRAAVSGGGKKPYRQKGTGNARQGSIRAPQFTGGAVAQGPVPRSYAQRTPKKMIAGALFGALSDRFRNDRIRVVEEVVSGQIPSTKSAQKLLDIVANYKKLLIVLTREDEVSWRSLANLQLVHSISYDQLNTYDVLSADAVIFTLPALHAFIAAKTAKKEVGAHS